MRFIQAIRLPAVPRLALVGAGGKTTAMFLLARELMQSSHQNQVEDHHEAAPAVLITTTTHLGASQVLLADRHVIIDEAAGWKELERQIPAGVTVVTGPKVEGDRLSGLQAASLERLLDIANAEGLPLLIEADGSRLRPLKAPAYHEPALPGFVDSVIVAAGLSGLGKPLNEDWVHRPERFAELSGLPLGAEISPQALVKVISHPQGGLKGIPSHVRRTALFNQADTEALRLQAGAMAGEIIPPFDAVVVTSLGKNLEAEPGSFSPAPRVHAVHEPVAGIVLAAGRSARYGQPKQLLTWRGEPLVRQVAQNALLAGLWPVVVVTGAAPEGVRAAVQDLEVTEVYNPDWEKGQSTSLKAGLRALPSGVGAAVFLLSDMPQVPVELIRALVKAHSQTGLPLAAPQVNGQRANPVLFDRSTFPAILDLQGDRGGRQLFTEPDRYPVAWVVWQDPSILLDVDTPDDYARLLDLE